MRQILQLLVSTQQLLVYAMCFLMLGGLYVSFYLSVCLHIYHSLKPTALSKSIPFPWINKHRLSYIHTQPQQKLVHYRPASLDHSERSKCSLGQWRWKGKYVLNNIERDSWDEI